MSYKKKCIFCNEEIRMSNDNPAGKWVPLNTNTNEVHECKNKQQQPQSQKIKQQLTLEDLNARLRKVEAALFGNSK